MRSVYIHVPFCIRKCRYCDFSSTEYREDAARRYVRALEQERSMRRDMLAGVATVYLGGGTPSVLGADLLGGLLSAVTGNGAFSEDGEFTIEVNPATLTEEKIRVMQRHGVNRVSLGVQSFSDSVLRLLGRAHTAGEAEDAARAAAGSFGNWSLDLIYGVPGVEMEEWEDTLEQAVSLRPAHVAAYELTPEEGTPLHADLRSGALAMPGDDRVLAMYRTACRVLAKGGYRHYEISNYCFPGRESRHNMNYWRRGDYLGLGPSAHSFYDGRRLSNVSDVDRYCAMLEGNRLPIDTVITPSPEEALREEIFLGLRTAEGIAIGRILSSARGITESFDEERYRDVIGPLVDQGHIVLQDDRLRISESSFAVSNALMVEIMRALGL